MLNQLDKLNPEAVKLLEPYARQLLGLDGRNIISLAVYGSATGNDFVKGKSNINLAVVARELWLEHLKVYLTVTSTQHRQIVVPLFLTQEHMLSSLDTFPMELLEIRDNHVTVFGQEMFAEIVLDPKHLRLQCEREIRSRLIRLRQTYLEIGANNEGLYQLLVQSLNSIMPILRSLLHLCQHLPDVSKGHILEQAGTHFGLDDKVFKRILELKGLKKPPKLAELEPVFGDYLRQLERLARLVDKLSC